MKPSSGGRDVDNTDIELTELWCQLGMLVIESRQPYESPKGWREGPHCAPSHIKPQHECSPQLNPMCKRKDAISREIRSLGRNNIPVCVEVMMLPDCDIHDHKVDLSHGMMRGQYLLLEQWKFQVIPKRSGDGSVGMGSLFQAVKSYLYFSQLSAWLNQTRGTAPKSVEYRVSPPAEFCTSTFDEPPELHKFPVCSQQHYTIQVTVATLPRQRQLRILPCPLFETERNNSSSNSGGDNGGLRQSQQHQRQTGAFLRQIPESVVSHSPKQTQSSATFDEPNLTDLSPEDVAKARCVSPCEPRRRVMSPGIERNLRDRSTSPMFVTNSRKSPRSESPCGATCASFMTPTELRYDFDSGGCVTSGAIMTKTPFTEYRDSAMTRSKTLKEFHNDDSSDCSESSTIGSRSQTSGSPVTAYNQPRSIHHSSSVHTFREKTTSPKFFLPYYNQPPTERVSSLSSSSDSSQNGIRDTTPVLQHRPSPPVDLFLPNREVSESLSKKLAKKLRLEPLTAFELEAQVNNSVPLDLPTSIQCNTPKSNTESTCDVSPYSGQCNYASNKKLNTDFIAGRYEGQESSVARCLDLSDPNNSDPKQQTLVTNIGQMNQSYANGATAKNGAASLENQFLNGNTTSNGNSQFPNVKVKQSRGDSVQNGAALENNGYHILDEDLMQNRFTVPKTPEKPLKTILSRHFQNVQSNQALSSTRAQGIPTEEERVNYRRVLSRSTAAVFNNNTSLPLQSSPIFCDQQAPIKRLGRLSFDFDENLTSAKAIKNSLSCLNLESQRGDLAEEKSRRHRMYSTSAPASTNCLLGNFEESLLNGRIEPCGAVEGFKVAIGASGSFCPKHATLPVTAFFFKLSEDNAPSPYLGHVSLESVGKRGYHVPIKGTIQVTLFNPNKSVVKMFVVTYDLSDMPPCCTTFLRQRTMYKPVPGSASDTQDAPHYLRYLIHLRIQSTKTRKLYLHSDIRMIFARDKFEYDSRIANYEYRSLTEGPVNPKYSPKK